MAKTASFIYNDLFFTTTFTKVDRKKVYGYSKIEVTDKDGNPCSLANITSDGRYILPTGCTGITTLDTEGNYIARSDMKVVDAEGNEAVKIPSVYDREQVALKEASIDDYLALNVKGIYQLNVEDGLSGLMDLLNKGKIFRFKYNYRAGYETDDAFLLSAQDTAFMVIGNLTEFEYIGLKTQVDEIEEEEDDDFDDFDMGMF